jgi:hypothetical protein
MNYDDINSLFEEFFVDWQLRDTAMYAFFARAFFDAALLSLKHCQAKKPLEQSDGTLGKSLPKRAQAFLRTTPEQVKFHQEQILHGFHESLFCWHRLKSYLDKRGIARYGSHPFSQGMMEVWDKALPRGKDFQGTRSIIAAQSFGARLREVSFSEKDQVLSAVGLDSLTAELTGKYEKTRVAGLLGCLEFLLDFRSLVQCHRNTADVLWYPREFKAYGQVLDYYLDRYLGAFVVWIEQILMQWRLISAMFDGSLHLFDCENPCELSLMKDWQKVTGGRPDGELRSLWSFSQAVYPRVHMFVIGY